MPKFVLPGPDKRFWIEVQVKLPDGSSERMSCEFASCSTDRVKDIAKGVLGDDDIAGYLVGWTDLVDEAGTEIQFTEENLKLVLSQPYIHAAICRAYVKAIMGGDDAGN